MNALSGESPRPAALTRICLGSVLLVGAVQWWPYAVELYSTTGPPMPVFPGTAWTPPVPSPAAAVAMQSLLVFALAAVAVGWRTRLSLFAALVLSAWLGLLDLPGTFKKYSVISLHLLLLLGLARAGGAWSVDALIRDRFGRPAPPGGLVPRWPRRLMRLFVASVYLGAALTKLRNPDFASGDLLEFALLDDLWGGRPLGRWLAGHPRLLGPASLVVLLFELWFPVLVWVPRLRRPMVAAAVAFHVVLEATVHLGSFSWVMLAALTAFVTDDDLDAFRRRVVRPDEPEPENLSDGPGGPSHGQSRGRVRGFSRRRFSGAVSLAAFLLAAGTASWGGVAVQRRIDRDGVFSSGAGPALEPIAPDEWARMTAPQAPPVAHYVHRLEVGRGLGRGRVLGDGHAFRRGELVHALVRFSGRRPPMRTTWLLIAPDGREVARRDGRTVDASRASVAFELTGDAPAGRYRVVLQLDGIDAAERAFELAAP